MKRIGVLTSGGDAPGMNAAIRAVVRTALYHGIEVMGIERGYAGLIEGDAHQMDRSSVSGIINRGGTILRTARSEEFMTQEGRSKAAENLNRFLIEGVVLIGGDGTYRGGAALHEEHNIPCVGIPGTIDNDIGGTRYTIGFDTAVNTALEALDRIRDTAASHDRLFLVEVMGRACGAIALQVGVAGGAEAILVPETETDIDDLCRRLDHGRKVGKNSSIVVIAEGDEAGGAFKIKDSILEKTGFRDIRVSVLGHLQRGGSPTATDRVIASRMATEAVLCLLDKPEKCKMVGVDAHRLVIKNIEAAWEEPLSLSEELISLNRILAS